MTVILTATEMRALEQEAIASGEVTGLELMERAGRGVVEAILEEWPEAQHGQQRAVILCGPGNNGGDGFVIARMLRERGWDVTVLAAAAADRLPPDAAANRRRLDGLVPVRPLPLDDAARMFDAVDSALRPKPGSAPLCHLIDAVFGIGLRRPFEGGRLVANVLRVGLWHDDVGVRVVAVDVPSGLDSDSGRPLADASAQAEPPVLSADLTVTFHGPKPGHLLADGPMHCGRLRVVDIGLSGRALATQGSAAGAGRPGIGWQSDEPLRGAGLLRKRSGHKYSHGHALLLSGGCGKGGAARLAARGALRIGAGLVTLAVPPAALQESAARLDAIMLRSIKDADALADLLGDSRLNALAAGPGLGTSDREAALLNALLDASRGAGETASPATSQGAGDAPPATPRPRAVVLDADALTLLSRDEALRAKLHPACVLTPHDGEIARLFPAVARRLNAPAATGPAYSRVDAARDAAAEAGCVVLLKGPDTVIADPSGRAAISAAVYDRAAPWLATAGSGDVLAGMIAGLLARGIAPFDAACTAAWLHVEAARSFGPGLIAEDLPEELPKVFRALGL